jgi:hypothetical protein
MIALTLQQNEAEIMERVLDVLLTDKAASGVMFRDGAERRCAKRISMKLHWAQQHAEMNDA